ncbi:Uu.00g027680.m01.CDS01 [Anthostomella pinea]|uniref:Uu.00g027680.m01.CDS01 n=1 Tax=Anthostomella pinea TaxID=933095 RepID=A0AAI8V8S7_9PEZI|nr:Uu.00g027680.m01.CDS01 [Anthostomella pinea]
MADATGQKPDPGLKITTASFFRIGTQSMAEAYRILGYRAHHGLDDIIGNPWATLEQAADAKWPRDKRPIPPLTRQEWDAAWGSFDAVTDLASPFALNLAKVYSEAKVVIVQRDFDSWWPSFKSENLDRFFNPTTAILNFIATYVFRIRSGPALRKMYFGFFGASSVQGIEANARTAYNKHFRELHESIPPEKSLEYEMGSDREPLCAFLGREIPNVEFPHSNAREQHAKKGRSNMRRFMVFFLSNTILWMFAVVLGVWLLYRVPT